MRPSPRLRRSNLMRALPLSRLLLTLCVFALVQIAACRASAEEESRGTLKGAPTASDSGTSSGAPTASDSNQVLFDQATAALEASAPGRAIALLELLADRAYQHPDVSFNRGVAYARRGLSENKRPGDLGRAAASLEETLVLRPSDDVARLALKQVRSEIARRNVREGQQVLAASPAPGRALVALLSQNAWATIALFGSLALALGLALRWWTRRTSLRLTGMVLTAGGALLFAVGALASAGSKHYRATTTEAVVIAAGARLLDAQGTPQPKRGKQSLDRIPEGALLHIKREHLHLLEVEWGTVQGFINAAQVRRLPRAGGTGEATDSNG